MMKKIIKKLTMVEGIDKMGVKGYNFGTKYHFEEE